MDQMKILVTGANGLLGQHLVKVLTDAGHAVIATGMGDSRLPAGGEGACRYYPADITGKQALHAIMRLEKPSVIVHAAAMTQVDECETRRDQSFAVNVLGTGNMLAAAERTGSHFIYISTDFVFDGVKGKYSEGDVKRPVNWYGVTKMQAERNVEKSCVPWAIVRTGLVYGRPLRGARSNIVTWVKESLENGRKIKVVSDQVRTPTYVEDLARGILLIADRRAVGAFHIAGTDILTPHEVAMKTAGLFGLDTGLIEKVDAASFSQPGARPPITDLLIARARQELGYEPLPFEQGLEKMFL
jgi:dTDP-4-dehydrorhamnose reductase